MNYIKNKIIKQPTWLNIVIPSNNNFITIHNIIKKKQLNTVCFSSSCPNLQYCWSKKTLTFMIMGNQCTRSCKFCHIKSKKYPNKLNTKEPKQISQIIKIMKLSHVVITSVTRDDLYDSGANHFANCINNIRNKCNNILIEILTPDFQGMYKHIDITLKANPNIFNHNIETTKLLFPYIKHNGNYKLSLKILKYVKLFYPHIKTKSGIMLGLGESLHDIKETLTDLKTNLVDYITIGQYLQPSQQHATIKRYIHPNEFNMLKQFAHKLGFSKIESGPLVRSSFHANNEKTSYI